jgi:uncharacterized protein (TIGR02145 family)
MQAQCLTDNTFQGTTDSDWGTASNWSSGCVPGGGTITGVINIAADCTVSGTNATNYTFGSGAKLVIASGMTMTNNGTGSWTIEDLGGQGTYAANVTITGKLEPGYIAAPPPSSVPTITIGTQTWMANNVDVGTMITGTTNMTNNSILEKYCYRDDPANCTTYGALYQWDEMMQYVTTAGTQGVCPTGFHLPTDDEWKTLEIHLGMTQAQADATGFRGTDQGSQLASNEPLWTNGALDQNAAFGTSGLAALPGGYRITSGSTLNQSYDANFWSSSESYTGYAWNRDLDYYGPKVNRDDDSKSNGFSVRCVQD